MNRLIITRLDGRILTALMEDTRAVQLDFEDEKPSILGNIYVGRVKDVVKNINAAFVDLGGGQTGYYSLDENPVPIYASRAAGVLLSAGEEALSGTGIPARAGAPVLPENSAAVPVRPLRQGDEIVVQVSRDAVKTKDAVLTGDLTFPGRFCVLTVCACGERGAIHFSGKIRDNAWKKQMHALLAPEKEEHFSLIVRTNAYGAPPERILSEWKRLAGTCRRVLEAAPCRTVGSLLYTETAPYLARVRDCSDSLTDEILTDDEAIFRDVRRFLNEEQPEMSAKLRFYQDPMVPLEKVYSIRKNLDDALQKRVWLKSGAYLVIEPTEAMTVIDVNTGRYAGKKNMRETVRMINLEAAREAVRQLRLRNLSGIILIDFINMESPEEREELLRVLADECFADPVKTTVVDMTQLGLVEITRKKIRKPLQEQR